MQVHVPNISSVVLPFNNRKADETYNARSCFPLRFKVLFLLILPTGVKSLVYALERGKCLPESSMIKSLLYYVLTFRSPANIIFPNCEYFNTSVSTNSNIS